MLLRIISSGSGVQPQALQGLVALHGCLDAAISRCMGEASTSYAAAMAPCRHFASKPAKKGAQQAPPKPAADSAPVVVTPMHFLKSKPKEADLLQLVSSEQRALAQELMPQPSEEGAEPAELQSLKQLGLPLSQRDILKLVHESMSNVAGQDVHFRPYVFSSVFQSAAVTAQYVAAAVEGGFPWSRVERFFTSSVELEQKMVRAIKVQVNGRLGRKASMAGTKTWEWGTVQLADYSNHIDYGHAVAMTRLGVLGIKVWIWYHDKAMQQPSSSAPRLHDLVHSRTAGPALPRSPVAWWSVPGPSQPAENRTWEAFAAEYDPASMQLTPYLQGKRAPKFQSNRARLRYLAAQKETAAAQAV